MICIPADCAEWEKISLHTFCAVLETEFAQRDFRAAAVDRIARLPNLTEPGLPAEEIRAQAQRTVSTVLGMTGRFLTARNDR